MKRVLERLQAEAVRRHRLLSAAAAALMPAFWLVYHLLEPDEWDPLGPRALIGGLSLVLLIGTFVSRSVYDNIRTFTFFNAQVIIQWIVVLAAVNDFSVSRVVGVLLVHFCGSYLFTSVRHNATMHVATTAGIVLAMGVSSDWLTPEGWVGGVTTVSTVLTAALFNVAWASSYSRAVLQLIDSEAQLREARDTLEDRVRERTQDLEREVAVRRAAETQASEASQAKSFFLANMSHELRTPLNAVIGYAELVHEDLDDEKHPARRDIQRILDAASYLLTMINDILDLAKVESGAWEFVYEETTVDALVQQAATTVAPQVVERDNRLHLEIQPDLPAIYTDRTRLTQVLVNLVHNAAKFTVAGDITIRVARGERRARKALCIEVLDTGPGIAPQDLERVFDKFVQLDSPASPRRKGTGLGLAIGREMARGLGGDLTVQSELGRGSTFSLWIPWRNAPPITAPRKQTPRSA